MGLSAFISSQPGAVKLPKRQASWILSSKIKLHRVWWQPRNCNMSRKCPTCEKTVYMGERGISSDHLQPFQVLFWPFDTQLSNTILHALQRSFQETLTNKRAIKSFLIFDGALVTLQNSELQHGGTFCVYCQKSKMLSLSISHLSISSFFTGEKKESLGNWFHPLCLKCKKCGRQLATGNHAEVY